MIFETVKTEGLAQLSYFLADDSARVAAVIDPRRDVEVYLELARRHGVRITHALETHVHADFVSGARILAERTGAEVCVGRSDDYGYAPDRLLEDGDEIELGRLRLRVLHTPGHSPEHVCFTLASPDGGDGDVEDEPWAVFTGDTLFAGSVGRPDLAAGLDPEGQAVRLHASVHETLLPLGDHLLVFPGHGAGSPCGADIGDRDVTTLGIERHTNPKLRADSRDAFVERVLADLPDEPAYYPRMKEVNARGPDPAAALPHLPALDPESFARAMEEEDAVVVDAREIEAFGGAHITGSLNMADRHSFPVWAGRILRPEQTILLVLPHEDRLDVVHRHLFRIGLDDVTGYLAGGIRSWTEAGRPFVVRPDLSVHELWHRIREGEVEIDGSSRGDGELQILDVRSDEEWEAGRIPGALHVFVPDLPDELDGLERDRPVAVYCGSGYRSSLAASLLAREGFARVHNVPGSMSAWLAAGHPLERGDA